jgi:hypothetical protein
MSTLIEPISEANLLAIRQMPNDEAAPFLDHRLRELEAVWKRSFVERGMILLEFEQRELWKTLGFHSLGSWLTDAAPQSRSDCYAALQAVKELRDIPRAELAEIPRCNIGTLRRLSSNIRQNPEVLTAAKTLPEREFAAMIEVNHPNQHIETTRTLVFKLDSSAAKVVEHAILQCQAEHGISREAVLEMWAVEYENPDADGYEQ